MKIGVFGVSGMLGHKIYFRLAAAGHDVYDVSRRTGFNVEDVSGVERYLSTNKFDVIVNCIGIVKQRDSNPFIMTVVNGLFPHRLVQTGARVVHFSTDCVFSGTQGPYTELSEPDAADVYGQSKKMGELLYYENALTLRTSIIGRELHNKLGLVEWLISQNGKEVKGYDRVLWSGVTTSWLADTVRDIIEEHPSLHGLYHVTSNNSISKYQLLRKLKDVLGLSVQITYDDTVVCDRRLDGERFEIVTGIKRPDYDGMLEKLALEEGYESIPK